MNLTKIQLNTPGGLIVNHATFMLSGASQEDPYILKGATGLDADEIVTKLNGRAALVNTNYYNLSLTSRQVVLDVKMNPSYLLNETIGDLRDKIYKAIAYNRSGKVELRFFEDSNVIATIEGFISKVESDSFSPDGSVKITINCDYPYLRDPEYTNIVNQAPYDAIAYQAVTGTWDDYYSTAPHGYILEISFATTVSGLIIQGVRTPHYAPFEIDYTFLADDVLHLSSESDNRYLYVVRGGVTTHLTDKVESGSIWPMMFPGRTEIDMNVMIPGAHIDVIKHRKTYWGI